MKVTTLPMNARNANSNRQKDQLTIVRDGVSAANAQGSNTLVRATVTGVVLEVPESRLFSDSGSKHIQRWHDNSQSRGYESILIFNGKVDETEVDLLREGMEVRITVSAIPDSDYPAVIEKISADGDRRQRHQHFQ